MEPPSLLYVDDDVENLSTLRRTLRGKYEVVPFENGSQALEHLETHSYPVIVADQRMPNMTGVEFLKKSLEKHKDSVGIVLTAYSDLDALIEGINAGVIYRYITKPWKETELFQALQQAFEKFHLVQQNRSLIEELQRTNQCLQEDVAQQYDVSSFAGAEKGLKQVIQWIEKVAKTNSTVLIRGESGVGKELVARAIHQKSLRSSKPFVRVNCGALPETLLESELFGHEKGAFTGAAGRRTGRFEAAEGGTVFLDEIGDISSKLQVNLLRVIQEREFERVGSNETLKCDIRILAATNQDLESLTESEKFRKDLYYRLNVFPIHVPPLRNRLEDLPLLVDQLLQKAARNTGLSVRPLTSGAMKKLKDYDWPGNVRELENVLERALILTSTPSIEPEDLILGPGMDDFSPTPEIFEITKELLEKTLEETQGNKMEAAKKLGLKRPTFYYHLKRLGILS